MRFVAGDRHAMHALPSERPLPGFRRPRRQSSLAKQNTTDGVLIVDTNGMILFANAIASRMFDCQPDDLLQAVFGRPIANKSGTEIVIHNPNRPGIAVELRVAETVWAGIPAVLVRLRDASERRAEKARRRRALKLEATGRLAASVAHDFNNLAAVLESGLRVLQRRLGGADPTATTLIEEMLGRTHNGAALAQRLLSFAKGRSPGIEPIDPNERIVSLTDLLGQTLGKGIEVKTDLDPRVETMRVDGDQFDIAILNLAINARDAMAGRGRLFITTAGGMEQPSDEKGNVAPFVRISVTDTGCGMTGEVLAHVMEPFFTTKGPEQGTGLGLSQVYEFARQSGGHIQIESQVGEGTTVHLFLPVPSGEARVR
ncbi:nitrogen regulation protein NR(II) [Mesorhizobium sp. NPDC059054]|uniref:two-component system sensor histidine kinase NtrB n=1 Tax=Mesorhizobium sp. NPDC059054 TaxID=3346711 RepID=UPI003697C301